MKYILLLIPMIAVAGERPAPIVESSIQNSTINFSNIEYTVVLSPTSADKYSNGGEASVGVEIKESSSKEFKKLIEDKLYERRVQSDK